MKDITEFLKECRVNGNEKIDTNDDSFWKLKDLLEHYKEQCNIPVVSLIDWDFIDWLDRGMWSNNENTSEGVVRQELWYNTYNFSATKNTLTKEQLYDKYKATLDEG